MTQRAVEPHDTVVCLYDRYGPSLYRYALMLLTDQAAAEDAVHEVFIAMLRSGVSARLAFDERYLRRAIRNECFSMLRQRAKRRQIQRSQEPSAELGASRSLPAGGDGHAGAWTVGDAPRRVRRLAAVGR